MSLDCRIQSLLSQSSSFLVVDRNSPAESCFNSKHTQVLGFAYSQVCWRTEPNSTGKMALRPGTKPALGISTKRHVGKVNLYRNNQYTINHFKRKSVNRSTDLFTCSTLHKGLGTELNFLRSSHIPTTKERGVNTKHDSEL